jgi:hypothetical protein
MTRLHVFLVILAAAACVPGDRPAATDSTAVALDDDAVDSAIAAEAVLPPMPDLPRSEDGKLVITAVGAFEMQHAWPARAGRCARPRMVLLIAEETGSGASVLLELPASGDLTGMYPVKFADSAGVVEAPAAQIGLQFFDATTADAYQGSTGEVQVRDLTDRRLSGQFSITVRHIASNRLAQVAGTFERVDVEPLPLDWCDQAAAARDSLQTTVDSAAR